MAVEARAELAALQQRLTQRHADLAADQRREPYVCPQQSTMTITNEHEQPALSLLAMAVPGSSSQVKIVEGTGKASHTITVERGCQWKAGYIATNPFHYDELPTSVMHREKAYVDLPTIQSVLKILPSAEWRAVIVFARFAGMRVQSELPLLKWVDIDEQENRFVVYSPKTKRTRRVPLFPEIRQALDDLRPITGDSEFVLRSLREKSNNWRTPLEKMLTRAGITPWAPLFNCLRSSAEIDIARQHGLQCATEWGGNSVQVAMRHYVRSTSEDFSRAASAESIFGLKDGLVTAGIAAKSGETESETGLVLDLPQPEKRGKPNKKRGFSETAEPRSMDDIGLGISRNSLSNFVRADIAPTLA